MPRYRVELVERVYYTITVVADDAEQARVRAVEEHQDGLSVESDNGSPEVESVTPVSGRPARVAATPEEN